MSSTLRSIAEKETSEEIHIVCQEEAHVDGMEAAGIDTTMLVESGRLKSAFPRVPGSPSPTLVAQKTAVSGKRMRSKRSSMRPGEAYRSFSLTPPESV